MKYTPSLAVICSLLLTGLLLQTACKKKKKSEDSFVLEQGVFTHSFMNNADFKGLVPLGNLNPPGHTLPTDHMYFYLTNPALQYPVFSPGNLVLKRVKKYINPTNVEYTLEISPGGNYRLIYGHVTDLEPALLSAVGAITANCQSYTSGGNTYTFCEKDVDIQLTGGQTIGKAGGHAGQNALDVGLLQFNTSTSESEYLCPLDYCTAALKAQLQARLGNYDGTVLRTQAPVCGEVYQNMDGTLLGIWFKKGQPKYPEDPHIAFVHDNVSPSRPVISVGVSQTGLPSGVYTFSAAASGTANRDFKDVVPGSTWCFQNIAGNHLLVDFVNANEIRVETKAGNACAAGEGFTVAAVNYTRGK
jgi:hypothetical protein